MHNTDQSIELRWIFEVIRRRLWLIIGCALLAGAIAYAATTFMKPVYQATTTLMIGQAQDSKTNEYNTLIAGERLAQTYSQILRGQSIFQAVIAQLNLSESPAALAENVTVDPVSGTQLIRLTVKSSSAEKAALVANTIADIFIAQVQTLNSGRYSSSLTSMQEKIKSLSDSIDETQSEIYALDAKRVQIEQDLSQLDNTMTSNRSKAQTLQQGLQSLQLTLIDLRNKVNVVEPAQVPSYPNFPPFTATVTLLVNKAAVGGGSNDLTFRQMILGRTVLDAAIAKLGLNESADDVAKRMAVASIQNTQLIQIDVTDSDSARAKLLANAIADSFILQVQKLIEEPYNDQLTSMQQQIEDLTAVINQNETDFNQLTAQKTQTETDLSRLESLLAEYRDYYRTQQQSYEQLRLTAVNVADTVVVSEEAQVPRSPIQNRFLYTLIAAVAGLMLGLGIAYFLAVMNDKVGLQQDITSRLGLNLVGSIIQFEKNMGSLAMMTDPESYVSESFRVLSTNIRLSTVNNPLKTLLVTSPRASDGKSTISSNLAVAMAKAGLNVILVDADLRKPRLHEVFGVNRDVGLTGALLKGSVYGCLINTKVDRLKILTSGETPPDPVEIIGSPKFTKLLDDLKQQADIVIIDSPPVLPVADTSILASITDGVLLVVRSEQTPTHAVRDAADILHKLSVRLIGVVLNEIPFHRDGYYSYYTYRGGKPAKEQTQLKKSLAGIVHFLKHSRIKSSANNGTNHKNKIGEEESNEVLPSKN